MVCRSAHERLLEPRLICQSNTPCLLVSGHGHPAASLQFKKIDPESQCRKLTGIRRPERCGFYCEHRTSTGDIAQCVQRSKDRHPFLQMKTSVLDWRHSDRSFWLNRGSGDRLSVSALRVALRDMEEFVHFRGVSSGERTLSGKTFPQNVEQVDQLIRAKPLFCG